MRKFTLLLLPILISSSSYALQVKSAVNNATISANISSTDVTRIMIQGDRIQSVRGVKGAYTRENDNNSGEIYIQPTSLYQHHAFTVLINTELGRHYTLLLNPMSVPSDTLMLVSRGVNEVKAAKFENSSPYELTITHLIRDMRIGSQPEGYAVRTVNEKKRYLYGNIAYIKLKTIYQGLNLRGEIWEVTNTRSQTITLTERDFYKVGTRAISLETMDVTPHGTTYLYRVVSHA
jgi:type-F conjugative transfer system secretin TraK